MTKQEFLSELRQRLTGVDENTRNEICADIEGHFAEGGAQGFSEEDICRNLGQPIVIAEQLNDEYAAYIRTSGGVPEGARSHSGEEPSPRGNGAPPREDTRAERDDRDDFDATAQRFAKSAADVAQSVASAASSFIGGLFTTYDINIDRGFTDARDIDIRIAASNFTVVPVAQSDQVRVVIRGVSRYEITTETQDGVLCVYDNSPLYKNFFIWGVKLETKLYIPAGFAGGITVKAAYGGFDARDVGGSLLKIKNTTGSILLERCAFNTVSAHASTGKVTVRKLSAQSVTLRSGADNVGVEDSTGNLDAHSSAGNVHITRHEGGRIKVNASAGNAVVADSAAEIEARSAAGNVDIRCERHRLGFVDADSAAGTVKITAAEICGARINSAAGSVKLKTERLAGDAIINASAGSVHAEINEVRGNVQMKAPLGSVKIKLPNPADCRIEASSRMGSVRNRVAQNESSPYTLTAESNMGSVVIEGL